jgi:hypothetical protein
MAKNWIFEAQANIFNFSNALEFQDSVFKTKEMHFMGCKCTDQDCF